ncbi:MAG TPA: amidohydrolase, partial [Terriglobales bacterium]
MRQQTGLCSRRSALKFLLVLTALLVGTVPVLAQSGKAVVIKGGKVLTVSHGAIENGVVVIENGKIAAVGDASTKVPSGAQVIDAKGMTVYPGIIDSETHLGLTEISADQMTNDLIETSDEIMPHMHVYDAFHAESALIPVTRVNGITNAIVAPDNGDTLPGQDILIQLDGDSSNQMILVKDIAMPMNFTGDQRRNESFEHAKYPQTRMGMAAQLRQAFLDAQDYMQKQADYEKKAKTDKTATPPKRDLKMEALLPYLKGERPVILAANSPADVDTAVSLANEFHLKFVLNHVQHAQKALDYIASLKVPVIVGPIWELPKQDER